MHHRATVAWSLGALLFGFMILHLIPQRVNKIVRMKKRILDGWYFFRAIKAYDEQHYTSNNNNEY